MTQNTSEVDNTKVFTAKYAGEAANVAHLLEKPDTTKEAVQRLTLDSQLAPHEMPAFLKQVKEAYDADQSKSGNLPNLTVSDDKSGIKVGLQKNGSQEAITVFERRPEALARVSDKPLPMTGELLGLTAEQTKNVLAVQAAEKTAGKGTHYFGDIVASLGYKTPQEINAALDKQDHLKAQRQTDDLSKAMPLAKGEGYFQMLKRTHPELSDPVASHVAHTLKKLHHNDSVLKVGDQMTVLDDKQKAQLQDSIYQAIHKKTGGVKANLNQPWNEIPTH